MTKLLRFLLIAALAIGVPLASRAAIHQTLNLNAAGSSVICVPGATTQLIVIQNNGSNSVRLSFDGGVAYVDPITGKTGTNPSPTFGFLLPAGQQVVICTQPYSTTSGSGLHKPIVAEMVTGTTTVDIVTDGTLDSFPTT